MLLQGLIDNESMEALKDKIEETFEKFNQTTEVLEATKSYPKQERSKATKYLAKSILWVVL